MISFFGNYGYLAILVIAQCLGAYAQDVVNHGISLSIKEKTYYIPPAVQYQLDDRVHPVESCNATPVAGYVRVAVFEAETSNFTDADLAAVVEQASSKDDVFTEDFLQGEKVLALAFRRLVGLTQCNERDLCAR